MRKITVFALMALFMVVTMAAAQATNVPAPSTSPLTLKVVSPVAGDKWEEGSMHSVAWTLTPRTVPDSMKIVLFFAPNGMPPLQEKVLTTIYKDNPEKWAWEKVAPVGKDLKLEVRAYLAKTKIVKGSQIFNIVPVPTVPPAPDVPITTAPPKPAPVTLTVKSPNGGEVWKHGANVAILWSILPPKSDIKAVDIFLTRDGGTPEVIAKNVDATLEKYSYTVAGAASEKCLVRIEASAPGGNTAPIFDVSDAPFQITSPVEHLGGHEGQQ